MSKSKKAASGMALVAAGGIAGAAGTAVLTPSAPTPHIEVVNTHLTRVAAPDGGFQWMGRACGYETVDGGRIGEPCWDVTLPNDELSAKLKR